MSDKRKKVVADINITPFTDVVLVLLIIFMITTPMLSQHQIKVDLPEAVEKTETTDDKIIEITIDKDGFVFIDGTQFHDKYIEETIKDKVSKYPQRPVVIKGDKNVKYDLVVKVMDKAKKAGVSKFGLAIDVPNNRGKA
ncbi:MAG: biopolymer transporter ExbD [Elusimicrobia bacterium]|jgi:biopolymer transport protein ExbD|nr:biopolymer transporter ExbD [Elusimicrobiota bacterium]MBR4631986.1 biopolymer transporter ExbD [Elusimicrobiota bacterium]